ncbi:unnamed protein product [Rhizophagus irregularis]|uniref:Uncharacterized protein n=1 Tax=Rhizophagus irregularis TaxID=588596 RepID=A0A2N1MWU0_9GLOM|nr:hypothetical protein RhiirC2_715094 [Rhizophagus irregularis]CAB4397183.1 unnamed protein product [Rhizophagus irregularis]CAB5365821.1 unnamed protein product [Rhizophagus irregularis]
MNDPSQMLKVRIKALKDETSNLMEEIVGYVSDGNTNECLRSLGILENTPKKTYELVDSLYDRIDELERKVNELNQEVNRLKDQIKYTKFFSDYHDWAKTFMQLLIEKLGGIDHWNKVETGLNYIDRNEPIKAKESECLNQLKNLLNKDENKDIGLNFTDIKFILEVRDTSNVMFHKNKQTSRDAEMKLNVETLPDDLKVYKPPLKKAFKAINRWRS